jgi:hypothetical protein
MCTVRVGGERAEYLAITILSRSHPDCDDYWDGNWVSTTVKVAAGGFRGEVGGDLRAEELTAFHRQLVPLVESLVGETVFSTMEDWLFIRVEGDGRGHMELSCEVLDQFHVNRNRLKFRLGLDQSFLRPMVTELGRALLEFPVRGI